MSEILEWDDFRERLRDAGWADEDIEREIKEIQGDVESGL